MSRELELRERNCRNMLEFTSPALEAMLFSRSGLNSVKKASFASFKDQLPKNWIKAAENELKGAPMEELIWHTPEVNEL